jgi:hypothetical protein
VNSAHPAGRYGCELPMVGSLGIGSAMDVAVEGHAAAVIGGGRLVVADLSLPSQPRVIGALEGLGNVRQVLVRQGLAYVSAREDGLFIIDLAQPKWPRLLSHYDPIELATGVALSGSILFIACRTCGVELVDVSDPCQPRHLSTAARQSEAHSVASRDGFLYVGAWGSSELVVVDIHEPLRPTVVNRAPVDGYADGVALRGNVCYVATGHHSRALAERPHLTTEYWTPDSLVNAPKGYGCGHGLELFDVSDPSAPAFLSRIKMEPLYSIYMDMWGVALSGRHAIISDSYNGVYVVDVSDRRNPSFAAHRQLDVVDAYGKPSPVGGVAVAGGCIYGAGVYTDLHILSMPDLDAPGPPEPDNAPLLPLPPLPQPHPMRRIYQPEGQVHAVAFAGDQAFVAAGSGGLHILGPWPEVNRLDRIETQGLAMDVKALGDRLYVAEGQGGLSVWRIEGDGGMRLLGRYRARYGWHEGDAGSGADASLPRRDHYSSEGASIRQVVVPSPGQYALLHVGPSDLHIVDVSDPTAPRCVMREWHMGLFHIDGITDGLIEGRFAAACWAASGLYWFDLNGEGKPASTGQCYPYACGARDGLAFLGDEALLIHGGGYCLLSREETRPADELPRYRIPGHELTGKPSVYGHRLYVSDRCRGRVSVVDISDRQWPRLLSVLQLKGHPGRVLVWEGATAIPAGYQGLLVYTEGRL